MQITLEEVQCVLRSKELQKSSTSSHEVGGQALNVGKAKGKKKFFGQNKKQKPDNQKETRSCHYCKKSGHIKRDCFSRKRKKEQEENGGHNNVVVVEEAAPVQALNVMEGRVEESLIVDSSCSFHICSHKSWFEDMVEASGSVLLGNDQVCSVQGLGSIKLKLHDHSVKMLTDVRFIPKIRRI